AALSREGLLWVLMWAHTALMAEYEAVRLCEVGRRVGRLAKSGGKAVGRSRAARLWAVGRSRAASRSAGEVGRQGCGAKSGGESGGWRSRAASRWAGVGKVGAASRWAGRPALKGANRPL
ncbi:hypothetical protein IKF40_02630, partial [Candidatus Saccharibacteria bacterium]|nr:hypothetical protein [Candidatus Saccharibacteria bacterium]